MDVRSFLVVRTQIGVYDIFLYIYIMWVTFSFWCWFSHWGGASFHFIGNKAILSWKAFGWYLPVQYVIGDTLPEIRIYYSSFSVFRLLSYSRDLSYLKYALELFTGISSDNAVWFRVLSFFPRALELLNRITALSCPQHMCLFFLNKWMFVRKMRFRIKSHGGFCIVIIRLCCWLRFS